MNVLHLCKYFDALGGPIFQLDEYIFLESLTILCLIGTSRFQYLVLTNNQVLPTIRLNTEPSRLTLFIFKHVKPIAIIEISAEWIDNF